jgi:hypothetical protein
VQIAVMNWALGNIKGYPSLLHFHIISHPLSQSPVFAHQINQAHTPVPAETFSSPQA